MDGQRGRADPLSLIHIFCARLLASLQPDYEGFELKIKNLFGYAMLDEHALRTLLEDMKRDLSLIHI